MLRQVGRVSAALLLARRTPVYYGWVILALACLATFLGSGVNNVSLSVVLRPLSEERGWPRSVPAGAVAAGTIVGGLLSPAAGRLADRITPRWLLVSGGLALGAASLGLAGASEAWQFYVWYVPARVVAQTLLSVVPVVLVASWFVRRRPRALGAVAMAAPLGSAVLAPVYQVVLDSHGWRAVFVLLGLLALVGVCPLVAVLVRARPGELGLRLEDQPNTRAEATAAPPAAPAAWTSERALRTPAVWLLAGALLCANLATGSAGLNLAAALADQGLPAAASAAAAAFALAGAVASLVWGVLAERVSARGLLIGAEIVSALAIVLLPLASTSGQGIGLAVALGTAARGQQALATILLAEYYGPRAFGLLAGLVLAAQTVALGLGPLVASVAYDLTGSYRDGFHALGGAYLAAAALAFLARRPTRPAGPTEPGRDTVRADREARVQG
jgi:MFS family permease